MTVAKSTDLVNAALDYLEEAKRFLEAKVDKCVQANDWGPYGNNAGEITEFCNVYVQHMYSLIDTYGTEDDVKKAEDIEADINALYLTAAPHLYNSM